MENRQYTPNNIETGSTRPTLLLCWEGKSKRKRCLMFAITTVIFVSFLVAVSLISLSKKNDQEQDEKVSHPQALIQKRQILFVDSHSLDCLSKECVKAAALIIERINETVDPCDNFFDFACGNFVQKTIIPDDKTSVSMPSLIHDEIQQKLKPVLEEGAKDTDSPATIKAKNLYASCMDIEAIEASGLEPLKSILKQLGGWPVLEGDSWDEENFSWIQVNYLNRKMGFSVNYLFEVSVNLEEKNNSRNIISLSQSSLGMRREYLMKGLNDSDVQAYLKYSIDVAVLLGAEKERAQRDMMDVLQFQIDIANICLTSEESKNKTKLYNIMKLGEMNNLTKDIQWVEYINTLLPYDLKVDENERIYVPSPNYFRNVSKLLQKNPKRVVSNYLLWRVAADSASYLSEDIRKLKLEYLKKLTGKTVDPPRWKECTTIVSSELPYAIGNLYVKNFFDERIKSEVVKLVKYLREAFKRMMKSYEWLDETTRQQAILKLEEIIPSIAYPQELLQDEKLTEYYRNVTVGNKTLLDNIRRIKIFGSNYSFSKLREKNERFDWKNHGAVAEVNAYYSPQENSIRFPAGILQGVYFELGRPNYMNFGGIGFFIGHEITHGFDNQGRQLDAVGNLNNWWQHETEERFLKKANCFVHQYGNYTAPENGLSLNGISTLGENIADNGGIKEAYRAYQKWVQDNGREEKLPGLKYTPDQLFWISGAQIWCSKYRSEFLKEVILTNSHSPDRFRVVGSFSNSEEFARDWNCAKGSKMNPEMKCSVW